jgi:glycosyltransferase involved in cell wall biosynthesis
MKLLILTQKVNKNDPILGFFHRWLEELSKKFEKITVICLEEGDHDLPKNVKVFSLGKESGRSKLKYIINFYKYIWVEKKNYDRVFVHMNQEYALLGGLFWKIMDKKIFLWRNHPQGSFLTRVAVWFSEKVFYTSPQAFVAQFKNSQIMPVGIDTDKFKNSNLESQIPNSILSLGRISPIKNIDKLIEAAVLLDKEGVDFKLDIVGDPVNKDDKGYQDKLFEMAKDLVEKGKVKFIPAVSQDEAVEMYQTHQIFVNLTPSGSMDKTILEAAACGCILITSNKYILEVINEYSFSKVSPPQLAMLISSYLNKDDSIIQKSKEKIFDFVKKNDLNHLVGKLFNVINEDYGQAGGK